MDSDLSKKSATGTDERPTTDEVSTILIDKASGPKPIAKVKGQPWPKIHEGNGTIGTGYQYKWAGNIAHLYEEGMKLPELGSNELGTHQSIEGLGEALERLRKENSSTLNELPEYEISETDHFIIQDFVLQEGLRVRRIKVKGLHYRDNNSYQKLPIKKQVQTRLDKIVGPPPSPDLVQWIMAKKRDENWKGQGREDDYWRELQKTAEGIIWQNKHRNQEFIREMEESKSKGDIPRSLEEVNRRTMGKNDCHQFDRDQAAVEHDVYELVPERDIVVHVDAEDEIVFFRLSKAFQRLYSDSLLDKVIETFDKWTYYQAFERPDLARHCMNEVDWLVRRPEFDIERAADKHHASCVNSHIGIHAMKGDPQGRKLFRTRDTLSTRHTRICGNQIVGMLDYLQTDNGAYGTVSRAVNFIYKAIAPELNESCVRVNSAIDNNIRKPTLSSGEAFCLRANLTNCSTQDHIDWNDAHYEFAVLIPFGNYKGGDMNLRYFGHRVSFLSGDILFILGHELPHSVSDWTELEGLDLKRHCIVHTNHEAVKRNSLRTLGVEHAEGGDDEGDQCIDALSEDEETFWSEEFVNDEFGWDERRAVPGSESEEEWDVFSKDAPKSKKKSSSGPHESQQSRGEKSLGRKEGSGPRGKGKKRKTSEGLEGNIPKREKKGLNEE